MSDSKLASIETAIKAYQNGEFVIIVDDEDRENEGDLAIAADHVTPDKVNFMATHGKGLICLAMQGKLLDRLNIPLMVPTDQNRSGFGTGFTVSIEAAEGVSTGISAADRSHTIHTLINPNSTPSDIAMPGHIFPIRARDGGVLERRGQTEASVELAKLAGLTPAASICEVMSHDGTMARLPELLEFAETHNMPVISVEALSQHMLALSVTKPAHAAQDRPESSVALIGSSALPTRHGDFTASVFRDVQGLEHMALVSGDPGSETPLVRVHSECMTGDAFGSLRCDCGSQLDSSLSMIGASGSGILIYLRQEGRGIGLGNKIRAYELQDQGLDTVDANTQLGFPADARDYTVAGAILEQLNVGTVKLITNNPDKERSLIEQGIQVSQRIPLVIDSQDHNHDYIATKQKRMGHYLPSSQEDDEESNGRVSVDSLPGQLDCSGVGADTTSEYII